MSKDYVYVVMLDGSIVYVSRDKEKAQAFSKDHFDKACQEVLNDWEIDDPNEKNLEEAAIQAGMDGENCTIFAIDIANKTEEDTVELPNGDEVDMEEILEKLEDEDDFS